MITETEQAILDTLTELDAAAKGLATAQPKPDIMAIFKRLDTLTAELPRGTDPNLLHYLHRKSYEKARLLLLGRDAENRRGTCGH